PDHDRPRTIRGMPHCVRESPSDALEIGKYAIAPFVTQAGKRCGKEIIVSHRGDLRSVWAPPATVSGAKKPAVDVQGHCFDDRPPLPSADTAASATAMSCSTVPALVPTAPTI